ncbi:MAG: SusD/RagB family nutrient-binding outer membrane lipoprotein [Cellulophaga sp.]
MKKTTIYKGILLSFLMVLGACETIDLDLLDNPNAVSPKDANIDLLLNGSMLSFSDLIRQRTYTTMSMVRMLHFSGPTYDNVRPTTLNGLWSNSYANILPDLEFVITKGTELGLHEHVGIAKILKSYTLTTLVDLLGDVPYEEALKLTENLNPAPTTDGGQGIYTDALELLKEAVSDFDKEATNAINGDNDIYYQGEISKWTKLANSLQLRIYNNTRLVNEATSKTEINKLITAGDLIFDAGDDFEIRYGTQDNDPDVRHPDFVNGYVSGAGYMATYFMNLLHNKKAASDPRTKYYFYRQSTTYPDPSTPEGLFTMPCLGESKPLHYGFADPFCKAGDGYWGRDHMNNDGGPPDGNQITRWGLYPAGGRYDSGQGAQAKKTHGAKGAGITPIWNVADTYFTLAEAAHAIGVDGDAKDYLDKGMNASFAKVRGFRTESIPDGTAVPTDGDVTSYISEVMGGYDGGSANVQLNIIMTESLIASWGNGLEPYNAYRRTGFPNDLQPAVTSTPGAFIRSYPYPAVSVERNQNMSAKPNNEVPVFWDTNPAGFID